MFCVGLTYCGKHLKGTPPSSILGLVSCPKTPQVESGFELTTLWWFIREQLYQLLRTQPLLFFFMCNKFTLSFRRVCVCVRVLPSNASLTLPERKTTPWLQNQSWLPCPCPWPSLVSPAARFSQTQNELEKIVWFLFFVFMFSHHGTDLLAVDLLVDEELHLLDIFRGVVGATGGRQPVSAGSPGLLVVAGQGLGQVPVSYKSAREDWNMANISITLM